MVLKILSLIESCTISDVRIYIWEHGYNPTSYKYTRFEKLVLFLKSVKNYQLIGFNVQFQGQFHANTLHIVSLANIVVEFSGLPHSRPLSAG